jgi:hypothetical protein
MPSEITLRALAYMAFVHAFGQHIADWRVLAERTLGETQYVNTFAPGGTARDIVTTYAASPEQQEEHNRFIRVAQERRGETPKRARGTGQTRETPPTDKTVGGVFVLDSKSARRPSSTSKMKKLVNVAWIRPGGVTHVKGGPG